MRNTGRTHVSVTYCGVPLEVLHSTGQGHDHDAGRVPGLVNQARRATTLRTAAVAAARDKAVSARMRLGTGPSSDAGSADTDEERPVQLAESTGAIARVCHTYQAD
jgi:hypothetical protein